MKKQFILTAILLCAGFAIFAQQEKLSVVAMLLFKNIKTKLTIAEKNQVATKLGFILSGDNVQPYALDKDSKEFPFTAAIMPTDMNKDGKEEIFVAFGNTYTSGNTGSSISLFIKNTSGAYTLNLGFPGTVPEALSSANLGYPDLLIGGPGFEYPVWRWNGKEYTDYKIVKEKDYEKLKTTNIEDISKAYQQTIKE